LDYECQRNYAANHVYAITQQPRNRIRRFNTLDYDGFYIRPTLSKEVCKRWVKKLDKKPEFTARDMDKEEGIEFLEMVLTPQNEQVIQDYFGCLFAPTSLSFYRTDPLTDPGCSFRWHVDVGPRCHLKMLVYLNSGHGGGTDLINRQASRLFERAGYGNLPLGDRVDDLDPISEAFNITYVPIKVRPSVPGAALIFESGNCIHKGILPTKGPRYVAGVTFIPFFTPWREFVKEKWDYVCANYQGGFGPLEGDYLNIKIERK
jgi:hypothetical protein